VAAPEFPEQGILWRGWNEETLGIIAEKNWPVLFFIAAPIPSSGPSCWRFSTEPPERVVDSEDATSDFTSLEYLDLLRGNHRTCAGEPAYGGRGGHAVGGRQRRDDLRHGQRRERVDRLVLHQRHEQGRQWLARRFLEGAQATVVHLRGNLVHILRRIRLDTKGRSSGRHAKKLA
jgi:hypothetical protein